MKFKGVIKLMRIWDIFHSYLNKMSLSGEHREMHGLYNIITGITHGGNYARHPETLRWYGKSSALVLRHDAIVQEMLERKMNHKTPMLFFTDDQKFQEERLLSDFEQVDLLLYKYLFKKQDFGRDNLYHFPGYKKWAFDNSLCFQLCKEIGS
jgi:hypothetical protein